MDIVRAVEQQGYHVVSVVSDQGGSNRGLYTKMGISAESPWMNNPVDETRRIYFFHDVPHLLKSCRNHLLDTGYRLPSGETIRFDDLMKLIRKQPGDLKVHHKLTEHHLTVKGSQRQRVRPAAQLLSRTTAALMDKVLDKPDSVKFFQLLHDWFRVMNSRYKEDPKGDVIRGAYGTALTMQEAILDEMKEAITKLRKVGAKKTAALLPFQQGIALACSSMKGLYHYLKDKYNMPYVMTARLNSDCVENLFSRVRGLGATYDSPDSTEAFNRLRLIIIGQDPDFVVPTAPVEFWKDTGIVQEEYAETTQVTADLGRQTLAPDEDDDNETTDCDEEEVPVPMAENAAAEAQDDEDFRDEEYDALIAEYFRPEDRDDDSDDEDDDDADAEDEVDRNEEEEGVRSVHPPPPMDGQEKEFDVAESALVYVAGWLACKFQHEYEELSIGFTAQLPEDWEVDPWLAAISRGGLIQPSPLFVEQLKLFEKDFDDFHGGPHAIDLGKKVISRQVDLLCEKYAGADFCHRAVIVKYVRFRTFTRMKYLNLNLAHEKALKRNRRKAKQFAN